MIDPSNRVAKALEDGGIPWRFAALPRNFRSGQPYGGVESLLLNIAAETQGYSSPWWATISEWHAAGGKVQNGLGAIVPCHRDLLFNWEQTDRAIQPAILAFGNPEETFDAIVKNLGVKIEFVSTSECNYAWPPLDRIRIPYPFMFQLGPGQIQAYYSSLSHELFHATEHRVGWEGSSEESELRAEMGSGLICSWLGVPPVLPHLRRHHDNFCKRWCSFLRRDYKALWDIAGNVTATTTWLLQLAGKDNVTWHHDIHNALAARPI